MTENFKKNLASEGAEKKILVLNTHDLNEGTIAYRFCVKPAAFAQKILSAVISLAFAGALIYVLCALPAFQTWYYILMLCILIALALLFCANAVYNAVLTKKRPTVLSCDGEKLSIREGFCYRVVPLACLGKLVLHLGDTFNEHEGKGDFHIELDENMLYYEVQGRTKIVPAPNMTKLSDALIHFICNNNDKNLALDLDKRAE